MRDELIREWSKTEIHFSEEFSNSHRKIVFNEFCNRNSDYSNTRDLHKITNEILIDPKKKIIKDTNNP